MSTNENYPFRNPDLPLKERVRDLVSRFTLEEKIALMPQYQTEVERLGVNAYKHGTEAAHGIAWLGVATSFPQPIGLACTWNAELIKEVGSVIGKEARAFFKKDPKRNGLTLWAPTVDMERDPRWGRTEEAYGEDPELTGRIASALIKGLQGDHPVYLQAAATLKHFLGNNNEADRGHCSASIDPRNMSEYYLNAFKRPFREGGAQSMMTAYNSINGTPAILHPDVMNVVKGEWGMDGFIVSDAGDMIGIVKEHHYYSSYAEAVAHSIKNGIDSITDEAGAVCKAIREALERGLLSECDLDAALMNTFRVRFRLGEFDPEELNPYAAIAESVIASPEHNAISLRAARESVVLLKNENRALPLRPEKLKKVAVVGPLADVAYRDWYSGTMPYQVTPLQGIRNKLHGIDVVYHNASDQVAFVSAASGKPVVVDRESGRLAARGDAADASGTFEMTDWGFGNSTLKSTANGKFMTGDGAITATADEVFGWFVKECFRLAPEQDGTHTLRTWNGKLVSAKETGGWQLEAIDGGEATDSEKFAVTTVENGLERAVETARTADAAIVFVGNNPLVNGKETVDRENLNLAPAQEKLIQEVHKANPNTIVVVIGSYPFALNWADEHIPAILYSSHGGQELGSAIADVLFGDYSPAGRLNMTWYRSVDQLPDMMDYDIIKGKRTYQYFDGDPLYPFGHGLTYAEFRFGELQLCGSELRLKESLLVAVQVENIGRAAGDEVVQMYIRANGSRVKRPLKQLKGFERIHLQPGEKKTVRFTLPVSELAYWDVTRNRYCVEHGSYTVMIGRSSADIACEAAFLVHGETVPPRNLYLTTEAERYDDCDGVYIDECKAGGTCVRTRSQGWIRFDDADFGSGASGFEALVSGMQGGTIEIRTDGPHGALIGTLTVPGIGGSQQWEMLSCPVAGVQSGSTVYIRFGGETGLASFRFLPAPNRR